MDTRWEKIAAAIRSSDPDRVNGAIEDIKDLDHDERMELFEAGFAELVDIYETSEDGYVRQSAVRVVEQFVPGTVAEFLIANDPEMADRISEQVDRLCGFLLETIGDDDGRVRQSTTRALKRIYQSYDALDDEATIESLIAELESRAETAPEDKRKHLRETTEDAEFFRQSSGERLLQGLQRLADRSE